MNANAAPCLRFDALEAGYDRPVVGPLTFEVQAGEIVALWGANGSGKTTLLNVPGGEVRVFAGAFVKRPGLRVAHQHQNPLPVRGIPLSGRELLGLTGASDAGLPDAARPLLSRRLSELSGGQLQFLQVWACLQAPVDLVILDEPTNNVDRQGVALLAAAVRGVRGSRAVLFVSHDRQFVDAVADRVVQVGSA